MRYHLCNFNNSSGNASYQKQPLEVFCKILQNTQESTCAWDLLQKKRLWYRCFPVKFPKFLRITFSQNTSGRLLLSYLDDIIRSKYCLVTYTKHVVKQGIFSNLIARNLLEAIITNLGKKRHVTKYPVTEEYV